jgi:hypothetical protein
MQNWVSGSDIMTSNIQIQFDFESANEQVVYLATKKLGLQFVVERPILRNGCSDGAQYQCNVLPETA